jgi:hypothetical protein
MSKAKDHLISDPLTPEAVADGINKLALMAFFPGDPEVRGALIGILMEMVETEEQLDWLIGRALKLYARWPGVAELRALYCSRWKPKDGVETYSTVYQDGIPSERPAKSEGPSLGKMSRNPDLHAAVCDLAGKKKL